MNLTIAKALEIPLVNECELLAGYKGLNREIHSVNSFDAPDVIAWLKPKELVLTTGYVFKNNTPKLEQLIYDLAEKQCAGLAIKLEEIPTTILEIANKAELPIIKIPDKLSLSKVIFLLLRELVIRKKNKQIIDHKSTFVTRLVAGNIQDEETILAEKKKLGLEKDGGYLCMLIRLSQSEGGDLNFDKYNIFNEIESLTKKAEFDSLIGEIYDGLIIVLQANKNLENGKFICKAGEIGQQLIIKLTQRFPSLKITIGIGNVQSRIDKLTQTYNEAITSIELGNRLGLEENLYCFKKLEAFTILHYAPKNKLEDFVHNNLSPLLLHDAEFNTDFIRTLDIYLQCNLRPTEAAQKLGLHRNTMHFRIKYIKEILGDNLNHADIRFKLQLALYARRLLVNSKLV
jgi:DNA-binding PucR family transcriptional regulator